MCAWGLGCRWCGGDEDACHAVGWVREEAGEGAACWAGTNDEEGRFDGGQAGFRRRLVAIDSCCSHVSCMLPLDRTKLSSERLMLC